MDVYALIRQAILDKDIIIATYNGHRREFCPHVLGRKNGVAHVLGYQFAGESSSGLEPNGSPHNWRCMEVRKLRNVTVQKGNWHSAPNHGQPQSCVDVIDVEVSY